MAISELVYTIPASVLTGRLHSIKAIAKRALLKSVVKFSLALVSAARLIIYDLTTYIQRYSKHHYVFKK